MKKFSFTYKLWKNFLVFFAILIIWQIIYKMGIFSPIYLPGPYKVLQTFLAMVYDGSIFENIFASLYRVLVGYFLAFILSFLLALIFYLKADIFPYFSNILDFLKNIPPLGLVPLLILWVGIGEVSKISIVFMASFFPIFLNIQKGFMEADKDMVEMGRAFSYNDREIFTKIVLPSSLKDIFVGARIGLGYAYRSIIAAEMLAASKGLGYLINFSRLMSRTDKVIVGILVIGFVGMVSDKIFVKFASLFLKGDLKNDWYKSI
ncbi:ABC transporter permease [Anaerococcus hydrogenalis]|uniref:ABC transporter permease n=1 Tax=Anaerococcus hydrogenalis TaxID=33029 RepID=UPI001E116DE0|nr:ABC transporter permease [Anaerococcus hydrogenalis]MBS5989624.1 ABC transporter permease [Anaerococcus hydrogenalis]